MPATGKITKRSTMQDVVDAYPSAQRALFRRYHIGGCHGCGYEPDQMLEDVAHRHDITDLDEVLEFIEQADEVDRRLQISPPDVALARRSSTPPRLIDVRTSEEWELARIEGATLMTEELATEMMRWPKDTAIVFYCHRGQRSLDAAAYVAGHGFKSARSMTGGIEAWSIEVDAAVPRYDLARERGDHVALRPLRSVVSQAAACAR